jgi:flagellar biosynthesis protein FlhG
MTTDLRHDQAEGLRRIFSGPRTQLITLVSTLPRAEKNTMLINLTAALSRTGSDVLLVDAGTGNSGIASYFGYHTALTLDDAVVQDIAPEKALQQASEGFNVMRLFSGKAKVEAHAQKLASAFNSIQKQAQVVLVDGEPDTQGALPLKAMEEGTLLLQLAATAESITAAYALIKLLHNRLGQRQYDIIVSGANEEKANIASVNLAMTAKRHLAVALNYAGSIPTDAQLEQATRLGKAVSNAFPMANASIAYKRIADYILSN